MAKVLIYDRPTPEAALNWYGLYRPDDMPAKDVHDIEVNGVAFRVKHCPNGDQMWIHLGDLPGKFMASPAATSREDLSNGA